MDNQNKTGSGKSGDYGELQSGDDSLQPRLLIAEEDEYPKEQQETKSNQEQGNQRPRLLAAENEKSKDPTTKKRDTLNESSGKRGSSNSSNTPRLLKNDGDDLESQQQRQQKQIDNDNANETSQGGKPRKQGQLQPQLLAYEQLDDSQLSYNKQSTTDNDYLDGKDQRRHSDRVEGAGKSQGRGASQYPQKRTVGSKDEPQLLIAERNDTNENRLQQPPKRQSDRTEGTGQPQRRNGPQLSQKKSDEAESGPQLFMVAYNENPEEMQQQRPQKQSERGGSSEAPRGRGTGQPQKRIGSQQSQKRTVGPKDEPQLLIADTNENRQQQPPKRQSDRAEGAQQKRSTAPDRGEGAGQPKGRGSSQVIPPKSVGPQDEPQLLIADRYEISEKPQQQPGRQSGRRESEGGRHGRVSSAKSSGPKEKPYLLISDNYELYPDVAEEQEGPIDDKYDEPKEKSQTSKKSMESSGATKKPSQPKSTSNQWETIRGSGEPLNKSDPSFSSQRRNKKGASEMKEPEESYESEEEELYDDIPEYNEPTSDARRQQRPKRTVRGRQGGGEREMNNDEPEKEGGVSIIEETDDEYDEQEPSYTEPEPVRQRPRQKSQQQTQSQEQKKRQQSSPKQRSTSRKQVLKKSGEQQIIDEPQIYEESEIQETGSSSYVSRRSSIESQGSRRGVSQTQRPVKWTVPEQRSSQKLQRQGDQQTQSQPQKRRTQKKPRGENENFADDISEPGSDVRVYEEPDDQSLQSVQNHPSVSKKESFQHPLMRESRSDRMSERESAPRMQKKSSTDRPKGKRRQKPSTGAQEMEEYVSPTDGSIASMDVRESYHDSGSSSPEPTSSVYERRSQATKRKGGEQHADREFEETGDPDNTNTEVLVAKDPNYEGPPTFDDWPDEDDEEPAGGDDDGGGDDGGGDDVAGEGDEGTGGFGGDGGGGGGGGGVGDDTGYGDDGGEGYGFEEDRGSQTSVDSAVLRELRETERDFQVLALELAQKRKEIEELRDRIPVTDKDAKIIKIKQEEVQDLVQQLETLTNHMAYLVPRTLRPSRHPVKPGRAGKFDGVCIKCKQRVCVCGKQNQVCICKPAPCICHKPKPYVAGTWKAQQMDPYPIKKPKCTCVWEEDGVKQGICTCIGNLDEECPCRQFLNDMEECKCRREDLEKFNVIADVMPKVVVCAPDVTLPRIIVCEPYMPKRVKPMRKC